MSLGLRASSEKGFFGPEISSGYDPSAIGICVSGGGYRATLFHAGAFLRMNELGLLGRASRIASVSGGSLATGILAMNWDRLDWDADAVASADSIGEYLLRPALAACRQSIDVGVAIMGLIPGLSAGNVLADSYDRNTFHGLTLNKITTRVRFIFCASNLQTGGLVRFTRDHVRDWKALESTVETIRLAQAVAASSAFPPVLSPVRISLDGETVKTPRGARYDDPKLQRRLVLVDGGCYDNLGLEAIWKRCGIILCSSAGQNLAAKRGSFLTGHMMRVVYGMHEISVDWRERILVNLFQHDLPDGRLERLGAYWTAGTDRRRYSDTRDGRLDSWSGAKPDDDALRQARDLPTRLTAFSREQERAAMLSGYAHADAAIRRYLLPDAEPPSRTPVLP